MLCNFSVQVDFLLSTVTRCHGLLALLQTPTTIMSWLVPDLLMPISVFRCAAVMVSFSLHCFVLRILFESKGLEQRVASRFCISNLLWNAILNAARTWDALSSLRCYYMPSVKCGQRGWRVSMAMWLQLLFRAAYKGWGWLATTLEPTRSRFRVFVHSCYHQNFTSERNNYKSASS